MRHGHILKSQAVARCGGPGICSDCALEAAQVKPDGNVHTIPFGPAHYESSECWCGPELRGDFSSTGGKKHFVHRQIQ